ncbi:GDYXXLXY domain-containing protein [Anoxybacteroides amylolyticum]|uniref:GDYXXLXY family protein n=1 Tax=Anoxybacteroides amylolyticum TaxID=294699 RepID=A0A160F104_9BACL|nr:GDYXXLXY domain-containing protein [Anoxybacillus amylolyticus]ANB59777.1 GDYXXLXY family protein [Anoxybacillus amylolyticus]
MVERVVKTGYLLGISLLVAAIIYFFAANWQGFDRLTKVALSIGMMGLFYGGSAVVAYTVKRHRFLSHWLFVCGAIAFGISVALIGQIYNSHADSFWLFLIWLIPSSFFALLTRYSPLRLLSVLLLQLTFWFYYFPSSYQIERSEWESFVLLLLFAVSNAVIFAISRSTMAYAAYIAMHGWLFVLFVIGITGEKFKFWPYAYALLFFALFYFLKRRSYVLLTGVFAGAFFITQYFRFVEQYFQEWVFFSGLLLAAAIIYMGALLVKRTMRRSSVSNATSASDEKGKVFVALFQALVTAVASALVVSSVMGLIALWTNDFSPYMLFLLAIGGFVVPALVWRKGNKVVRYTLLAVGYMLGAFSASGVSVFFLAGYSAVLAGLFFRSPIGVRIMTAIALSIYGAIIVSHWTDDFRFMLLVVLIFNGILYTFSKRKHERIVFLSLSFGALVLMTTDIADRWDVLFHILFVTALFGFLFFQKDRYERAVAWGYWWIFFVWKYYEYAWDLLHKSLTFSLAGIVLLTVTALFEKRKPLVFTEKSIFRKKGLLIGIIALQVAAIGYTAFSKEQLLTHGKLVKLQLVPIDPRSLLQGDYVRLGYEISTVKNVDERGTIQVILRKDEEGVYRFVDIYSLNGKLYHSDAYQTGDVLMNGKLNGDTVVYGIESYFVPEKTGGDVQRRARFAYVRVSQTGDAILEKVSD